MVHNGSYPVHDYRGGAGVNTEPSMLEAAYSYIELGFQVFPVHWIGEDGGCSCRDTECGSPGKHPCTRAGFKDASDDHGQITTWWTQFPDANIGVATGQASGLYVVDIEKEGLADFSRIHGDFATPTVFTGGGGKHLWFDYPSGKTLGNRSKLYGLSVDIRGEGGYVLAPPSNHKSGDHYKWLQSLDDLPSIPVKLLKWIEDSKNHQKNKAKNLRTSNYYLDDAPGVGEGERHNKLLEYVGRNLAAGETAEKVLPKAYDWASRCRPPIDNYEVERVVSDLSQKRAQHEAEEPEFNIAPFSFASLREQFPERRPELIEGVLRSGETWNIIAAAKVGKSWLVYGLAMSVAMGFHWLGKFRCHRKRVLIIDNELHPEELSFRLGQVAKKMPIDEAELDQFLDVIPLRGNLLNINQIGHHIISAIEQDHYGLIILDAKYRAVTGGENDNDDQKDFYNLIDRYANQSGAAWVLVHHSSKGDQSGKSVTDVGAGGGSQSRAADVHMVFREHEEESCIVIDAAMRSHKPVEPVVAKFEWPLWKVQDGLDARDLKKPQGRAEAAQDKKDRETIEDIQRILSEATEPLSVSALQKRSVFGRDRVLRGINLLANADELDATMHEHANGKSYPVYSLIQGSTAEAF